MLSVDACRDGLQGMQRASRQLQRRDRSHLPAPAQLSGRKRGSSQLGTDADAAPEVYTAISDPGHATVLSYCTFSEYMWTGRANQGGPKKHE